jgi:DUF2971 family protein
MQTKPVDWSELRWRFETVVIQKFRERALNSVRANSMPKIIYHYTDNSGFLGIVGDRAVRASHYKYMNDPQELSYGFNLAREAVSRAGLSSDLKSGLQRKLEEHRFPDEWSPYLACFCERQDVLGQWRAYGNWTNGGFALGFSTKQLPNLFDPCHFGEPRISSVIYKLSKQKSLLKHLIDLSKKIRIGKNTNSGSIDELVNCIHNCISYYALIFKNGAYEQEDEFRIILETSHKDDLQDIHFRAGRFGLTPYRNISSRKFPLVHAVVGPGPYSELSREAAQNFLQKNGYKFKVARSDTKVR